MEINKKISIIVPVYMAEKTIDKTIESIINQTYKNLEIILIDDGSKDCSAQICDNFAQEDKRIKVIHTQNKGVSAARNLGIDYATGDYIQFIDSDDSIENNMCEKLIMTAEKDLSEVVVCSYKQTTEKEEIIIQKDTNLFSKEVFLIEFSKRDSPIYMNPPWNRIIRTRLLKENNIRFRESISFAEDLIFNMEIMKYIKNISIISDVLYIYNMSDNGLCNKKRDVEFYWNNTKKIYEEFEKLYLENNLFTKCEINVNSYLIFKIRETIKNIFRNYPDLEEYKKINIVKDIFNDEITKKAITRKFECNIKNLITVICIKLKLYSIFTRIILI